MFTKFSLAALVAGASAVAAQSGTFPAGVIATGTMGPTNPTAAVKNTPLNQTSYSRLLSLNSIDDFCLFAPPNPGNIGDTETEEVAWCTQPRNNARLIPDGTLSGVLFTKNDFYVQITGYGDLTKLNVPAGDEGGELDPHGAFGAGNPIGGNVTTNVTGQDINVAEWMQYISYNQFCIRACINANATYHAGHMCWHELDEMGCEFVMPGNYDINGTFASCAQDVAYPPGWYPVATAGASTSFSTFAQYFTGVYTQNGTPVPYTVGTTVTPSSVYFTPSSSSCLSQSTVKNGILTAAGTATSTIGSVGVATASASATVKPVPGAPAPGSGTGSAGPSVTGTGSAPAKTSSGTGGASSGTSAGTSGASAGTSSRTGATPSNSGHSGARTMGPQMGALVGITLASVMGAAAGAVMLI